MEVQAQPAVETVDMSWKFLLLIGVPAVLLLAAAIVVVAVLVSRKSGGEGDEGGGSGIGTVLVILCIVGGLLIVLCAGAMGVFWFRTERAQPQVISIEQPVTRDAAEQDIQTVDLTTPAPTDTTEPAGGTEAE